MDEKTKMFDSFEEVEGMLACVTRGTVFQNAIQINEPFEVRMRNGIIRAKSGDYLVKGGTGELYAYPQEAFNSAFDWVTAPENVSTLKKPDDMSLEDILREFLDKHDFDGLMCEQIGCSCSKYAILMNSGPDCPNTFCRPGCIHGDGILYKGKRV